MNIQNKQKVTVGMLLFWRTLITAGVAAILWLQSTFLSKESFKQWEIGQIELRNTVMRNLDGRFDSVQIQLNRIENKLERLPPRRADLNPSDMRAFGKSWQLNTNLHD